MRSTAVKNFLRTLIFSALCLMITASGFGQQQRTLQTVFSETELPERKLNRLSGLKRFYSDSISVLEAMQNAIVALHESGYATAGMDSIHWKKDTVTGVIHVGKRFRFNRIDGGNIPEEILKRAGFKAKDYSDAALGPNRLRLLKGKLLKYYEDHGHPFAQVELTDIELEDHQLTATLHAEPNDLFVLDSIIVKGNGRIRPKYLQNYLGLKPGAPYDESRMGKVSTRTKEIAFVRETKEPEVVFNNGKADLYVYLDKQRASQFDGILGVLPSNEEPGKVLITGELSVKLLSAFKRGELIDLSWRKMQARTQNLNIHLNYPFLFNTAFGLDGVFELYKRDSLFLNLRGVAGAQYHLIGNDHIRVFADIRSTNVLAVSTLNSGTSLNPDNVDSRAQLFGFGYNMQRLDYRLNPRSGFEVYAEASAGSKRILQDGTVPEERYDGLQTRSFQLNSTLRGAYFIPIPNRSTVKLEFKGGYMLSKNLFESEAFRIGGLRTLRGFDEESIFATMYGIATLEYRFLLDQNSYVFAFFDGAYYENQTTNRNVVDRPFGFGVGISFFTKIGVFSLNYALGRQFNNPIDFRAGKIHFGIVSYF